MIQGDRFNISAAVVGILNSDEQVVGTGFFVAKELLVTCAHLIEPLIASLPPRNRIVFPRTKQSNHFANVGIKHSDGRTSKAYLYALDRLDDIAVLSTDSVTRFFELSTNDPDGIDLFESYIYPTPKVFFGPIARGEIRGVAFDNDGRKRLQLFSEEIREGSSGSPVMDIGTNRVLGMISSYLREQPNKKSTTLFAIPADSIRNIVFDLEQPSTSTKKTLSEESQEKSLIEDIKRDPKRVRAYLDLSSLYEKKLDFEKAEALLRQAIEVDPSNAKSYLNLGRILEKQNMNLEALATYEKALSILPNDPDLYQRRGLLLAKQGRSDAAINDLVHAAHLRPGDDRLYRDLSSQYEKIKDLKRAAEYLMQAISIRPTEANYYKNLGRVYEKQNNVDLAISAFRTAYELKPDKSTQRRLEELSRNTGSQSVTELSDENLDLENNRFSTANDINDSSIDQANTPPESDVSSELLTENVIADDQLAESFEGTRQYTIPDDAMEKHVATDEPIQMIKQDRLDFKIYVNALCNFILSEYTATPITISVDGAWGTGKSSLMSMLKGKLDPQRDSIRKIYEWIVRFPIRIKWFLWFVFLYPAKVWGKLLVELLVRTDKDDSGIYLYFGQSHAGFLKYISNIVDGFSTDPKIFDQPGNESMDKWVRWWAFVYAKCEPMQPTYHHTVWLNAWKFDNQEEVWASLALATMEQIKYKHNFSWRLRFWWRLTFSRFSVFLAILQILKQFLLPLIFALLAISFDVIITSFDTPLDAFSSVDGPVLWFLWSGFAISGILKVSNIFKDPFQISLDKVFDHPNYKDKVSFLNHFEKDFAKIVRCATQNNWGLKPSRLIIFIDDLDRCEPPRAADIVEAVNLFLDVPGCIFVIGMDSNSVAKSIEVKYKDLFERMKREDTGIVSLGRLFLDKIVQVPFYVPRATPQQISRMVEDLMGRGQFSFDITPISTSVEPEDQISRAIDPAPNESDGENMFVESSASESVSETLSPQIDPASYSRPEVRAAIFKGSEILAGNPRQVKTFINLFRLSIYIANERGIFEERIIAEQVSGMNLEKLAIWIACSVRWHSLIRYLHTETQITPLRNFLGVTSAMIQDDFAWAKPPGIPAAIKTRYKKLRKDEAGLESHWCYLPWEWWLLDPDFLRAIKSMNYLWTAPGGDERDWLKILLTMTKPVSQ